MELLAGIDASQVVRYDQNTPPLPLPSTRPGAIAGALASINGYPAGGYKTLRRAIAGYNGVEPDQIGGYRPKKIAGPHREWLMQRCRKDFTVRGLVAELAERGQGRLPHDVGIRPRGEAQL